MEGRREGRREGLEKGLHKGEVEMLLRLLRARFRRLPAGTRQRLMEASSDQLRQWSVRLLDAQRLEQVFEDEARNQ